jgi:geranylgeranyl diphosphate synthase type II
LAKGEMLKSLTKWIRKEDFNRTEKINAVTDIYNNLNIRDITQSKIMDLFRKARLLLNKVSVSKERKSVLEEFAFQLMKREK